MAEDALRIESEDGTSAIYLEGDLHHGRVAALWDRLRESLEGVDSGAVVLDLRGVTAVDSAGVAMLRLLSSRCRERGLECTRRNVPEQARDYLQYVREHASDEDAPRGEAPPGFVTRIGEFVLGRLDGIAGSITFLGRFLIAGGQILRHPRRFGWGEILYQMQRAGAQALFFLILLSLLLGFIIGMQATTSMEQFGMTIRVADAVTLGTMKEMAPLLTAIMIVGRSGAAYTAELGTMQVKQEIDALEVMGVAPMNFLVLPRVFGLALAGPLLTVISDGAGIVGGIVQAYMVLDVSPIRFLAEVSQVLRVNHIVEGLIKGFLFALMIGMNGCFHGLRTGSAAENVGVKTTTSVVTGIFLIVALDAALSAVFFVFRNQ